MAKKVRKRAKPGKAAARGKARAKPAPRRAAKAAGRKRAAAKPARPARITARALRESLSRLRDELARDSVVAREGWTGVLGQIERRLANDAPLPALFDELGPIAAYAMARVVMATEGFAKAAPRNWSDASGAAASTVTVVTGDLHAGELALHDGRYVVVLGDVDATLLAADETATLVIGGRAKTRAVSGDGNIIVVGDLEAELAAGYYEAGIFAVGGMLRASLAVFASHTWCAPKRDVGVLCSVDWHKYATPGGGADYQPDSKRAIALLEARVHPSVLTGDTSLAVGRVDLRALRQHVVAGEPALRT